MLARLALLFVLLPLIDLVLLVRIGQAVGLWPTLALVVGTGLLGASLARREGLRTWLAIQRELARGKLPGTALLDGFAVLVGGAFLIAPGVLTDVAGLLLLFPPSRAWLRGRLRRWLEREVERGAVRVIAFGPGGVGRPPPPARGDSGLDPRHEIRPGKGEGEGPGPS